MSLFKEKPDGSVSWTRVRGFITLVCGIGLAFYSIYVGKLDQWAVMLILGMITPEVIAKTWQKKMEK